MEELGITSKCTTVHHPQCNGLVERFHRQLKASLKARLPTGQDWVHELPLVLLSLRFTPKADPDAAPSDLVFGEPIRLPGQFLSPPGPHVPPEDFANLLRQSMARLRATPPIYHGLVSAYEPKSLQSTDFVYVRSDGVQGPLQLPYSGPFKV